MKVVRLIQDVREVQALPAEFAEAATRVRAAALAERLRPRSGSERGVVLEDPYQHGKPAWGAAGVCNSLVMSSEQHGQAGHRVLWTERVRWRSCSHQNQYTAALNWEITEQPTRSPQQVQHAGDAIMDQFVL